MNAELYISENDIHAGQAIYTRFVLQIYNFWVIHFSNRFIWRCPKKFQQEQYHRYATSNHLDIGVGTGYYLKHNTWPSNVRLALMDINRTCLNSAKRATQALLPTLYQVDVFKLQEILTEQFDSISTNYLLHCLPGSMHTKSIALGNIVALLKPNGVLFGATILSDEHLHTPLSRFISRFYNQKNYFSNRYDTQAALLDSLQKHLTQVEIEVIGCVALFKGYKASTV